MKRANGYVAVTQRNACKIRLRTVRRHLSLYRHSRLGDQRARLDASSNILQLNSVGLHWTLCCKLYR